MKQLLNAIVQDDLSTAEKLLKADRGLASARILAAKLYRAKIFHWIYAGDTPLHLAAAGYRVEIVEALLRAGADPNAAGNRRAASPLHYAADGFVSGPAWDPDRQVGTIGRLLDHGADLHLEDKNGATALHRAVRTRCASAVRCLIQAGSEVMARNKSGSTPFHLAVQNTGRGGSGAAVAICAQRQIITDFLSLGLSPDLKSGPGRTVRDCARSAWIRDLLDGRLT